MVLASLDSVAGSRHDGCRKGPRMSCDVVLQTGDLVESNQVRGYFELLFPAE